MYHIAGKAVIPLQWEAWGLLLLGGAQIRLPDRQGTGDKAGHGQRYPAAGEVWECPGGGGLSRRSWWPGRSDSRGVGPGRKGVTVIVTPPLERYESALEGEDSVDEADDQVGGIPWGWGRGGGAHSVTPPLERYGSALEGVDEADNQVGWHSKPLERYESALKEEDLVTRHLDFGLSVTEIWQKLITLALLLNDERWKLHVWHVLYNEAISMTPRSMAFNIFNINIHFEIKNKWHDISTKKGVSLALIEHVDWLSCTYNGSEFYKIYGTTLFPWPLL